MYNNILIPTDGGDEAQKATEHGVELAASLGATVHALYVKDYPGTPRALSLRDDEEEMRERYEEYGQEVTGEVANAATEAGVECVTATRAGAVHEEIRDYADDEEMDVIVIGTGYRGKIGGLLGGTTEKVVRTANVPVTVVRMGAYE